MARSLGSEVRQVRQLKGLSLKAASQPAGLSATYLQKLERGEVESPSPHRLHRLAQALGMSYVDLFKLAGYPLPVANDISTTDKEPSDDMSALRKAFLSPEFVSDEEIEQLAGYLNFMRRQTSE